LLISSASDGSVVYSMTRSTDTSWFSTKKK
jgi:hypothetical protein